MNKYFRVASILTAGVLVGVIAGKFAYNGISKIKRNSSLRNNARNFKYTDEYNEFYFV